jgi:hypothetical protein
MAWEDIISDPDFQQQTAQVRAQVAVNYFRKNIASDYEFQTQPDDVKRKVKTNFFATLQQKAPFEAAHQNLYALGKTIEGVPRVLAAGASLGLTEKVREGADKLRQAVTGAPSDEDDKYENIPSFSRGVGEFVGAAVPISAGFKLVKPIAAKAAKTLLKGSRLAEPLAAVGSGAVLGAAYTTAEKGIQGEIPTAKELGISAVSWAGLETIGLGVQFSSAIRSLSRTMGVTPKVAYGIITKEAKLHGMPDLEYAVNKNKVQKALQIMEMKSKTPQAEQWAQNALSQANETAQEWIQKVESLAGKEGPRGTYADLVNDMASRESFGKNPLPTQEYADANREFSNRVIELAGRQGKAGTYADLIKEKSLESTKAGLKQASEDSRIGMFGKPYAGTQEIKPIEVNPDVYIDPEELTRSALSAEIQRIIDTPSFLRTAEDKIAIRKFMKEGKATNLPQTEPLPSVGDMKEPNLIKPGTSYIDKGDKFIIKGEEFTATKIDGDGYVTLKDGVTHKISPDDTVSFDAINKQTVEPQESTEFKPFSEESGTLEGFSETENFNLANPNIPKNMGDWKPAREKAKNVEIPGTERTVSDFITDVKTVIGDKERGSISGKKLTDDQIAAIERISADAKAVGKDIATYMKEHGATPEVIARTINRHEQYVADGQIERSSALKSIEKTSKNIPLPDGVVTIINNPKQMKIIERIWGNPYWIGKRWNHVARAVEREQIRESARLSQYRQDIEQVSRFMKLKGKDLNDIRKAIWDINGKKVTKTTAFNKDFTVNPRHYEELHAYLNNHYNNSVADVLTDIRKSLDQNLLIIKENLRQAENVPPETIQDFLSWVNAKPNYFPKMRYGNIAIRGLSTQGAEESLYRQHINAFNVNSGTVKRVLKRAQLANPDIKVWEVTPVNRLPEEVFAYPIPIDAMQQIFEAASARIGDQAAKEAFEAAMPKAVADIIKTRGFGQRMMASRDIPGYEMQDIQRVLHDYKSGLHGWLTKMDAAKDFSKILYDIKGLKDPSQYSYASRYIRDVMANSDNVDKIVDGIRATVYMKNIVGVVKTGAVNLTQNIVTGIPRLSMETNFAGSKYLKGASSDIANVLTGKKFLPDDEQQLIRDLFLSGTTDAKLVREMQGRIDGFGMVSDATNATMDILGLTMSVPERFNRVSLGLTAYRVAKRGQITNSKTLARYGLSKGQKANYETALKFSEDVVNDAHFMYGKGNLPEPLRGAPANKIGRAAYSLQSFNHNLFQLWGYMLRAGGRGYQAFVRSMAAQVGIAGLKALPFIGTLNLAYGKSTGRDLFADARKYAGDKYKDLITYGAAGIAGIDLSGSFSVELPMVKDSDPMSTILGAPWSMFVEDPAKAIKAIASGNSGMALESILPRFAANALAGKRMQEEGVYTATGKRISYPGDIDETPVKLNKLESTLKAFGFNPLKIAKIQDANKAYYGMLNFINAKQEGYRNRYANAIIAEDDKAIGRVEEEVDKWNSKMEAEGLDRYTIILRPPQKIWGNRPPRRFIDAAEELSEDYE